MGKQCWSQAVLESGSWGHSVLQTPALVFALLLKKAAHDSERVYLLRWSKFFPLIVGNVLEAIWCAEQQTENI